MIDTIIPRKAVGELARIAIEADGEIGFAIADNHVFFQAGQRRMAARRLAQNFPNYELVIPKENTRHPELDTDEAAAALRRMALMADNLKRVLMRACRDALAIIPCGHPLDSAWAEAAEAAADEYAARAGAPVALDLAAALVKIARMIPLRRMAQSS